MAGSGGRGARRKAALLEAARAVFLEHGYGAATLDRVIRRSGGSRATLYRQFGSKEGLFAAIIADLCREMVAPLAGAELAREPPQDALLAFGRAFMAVMMRPDSLALYRVVIAEGQRFPELAAAAFAAGPAVAADKLAAYLEGASVAGVLALADPALAARQFLEMVKGDLHFRALLGTGPPPSAREVERCVALAVPVFLDGARPRPTTGATGAR